MLCIGVAACGGAGVPTGGGTSTPIPIELPSATGNFSFPNSLGVGVGTVSSSSSSVSAAKSAKALSGSGAPERALSFVDDASDRLDALLLLLSGIEVENNTATTATTGTTAGGSSYRLDFSSFTFPALSNQQISTVDCSASCSGNAGELPMCVRLYVNNRRVFVGKFTALPAEDDTGQGAGCFRLFGTHNTGTNEDAQIRGVETYVLSGVWDQQATTSRQLELYWSTSLPDLTGFDVETSHAYLTETAGSSQSIARDKTAASDTVVQAAVLGTHADFGAEADVEFTATWTPASGKLYTTYTVDGESASQSCVTLAGSAASGCTAQELLAVPGRAADDDVTLASTTAASTGFVGVFAGNVTSYTLDVDGTVYGWGNNYIRWAVDDGVEYTLGTGEGQTNVFTPAVVNIAATQLSAGPQHAVARARDGTVWTWGSNRSGQLGNGTTTYSPTPIQVSSLSNIITVGAGDSHNIALRNDGTIWAWGDNGTGQLGDGTTTDRLTPVLIGSLSNVVTLAAGSFHNLALRSDGTVWGWGWSVNGEITPYDSNSSPDDRYVPTPTQIPGISDVVDIAAGSGVSLAVKRDGTLWVWGGSYCDVENEWNTGPRQVTALSNIVDAGLGANSNHFLAIDASGRVFAWGENDNGQLGDGTTIDRTSCDPTTVNLDRVIAVAAGMRHSLALKNDGTVWAWGDPSSGQLGIGINPGYQLPPQTTPVEVTEF